LELKGVIMKTRLFEIVFLCVIISVAGIVVPVASVSADTGTVVNSLITVWQLPLEAPSINPPVISSNLT